MGKIAEIKSRTVRHQAVLKIPYGRCLQLLVPKYIQNSGFENIFFLNQGPKKCLINAYLRSLKKKVNISVKTQIHSFNIFKNSVKDNSHSNYAFMLTFENTRARINGTSTHFT